jgi:hypothetical protein
MDDVLEFSDLCVAEAAVFLGMDITKYEFRCSLCGGIHNASRSGYHLAFECYLHLWKTLIKRVTARCYYFSEQDDPRLLEMAILNATSQSDIVSCYVHSGFYNRLPRNDWYALVNELAKTTKPKLYMLTVNPLPMDQLRERVLKKLSPGTLKMMRLK